MDIESALKTIGDWISKETESRKYPKGEIIELSESLQALKSEIARQSVKSEDVQEAIEHFVSLQKRYTTQHDGINCKRVKTIITAPQAYQPTTRKDRTVEEVAEAIKQKTITDAMDYLNKNMKQPFIEKESELNDV